MPSAKAPTKRTSPPSPATARNRPQKHDPPLLFHLPNDPGERFNVAADHPEVIADIQQELEKYRATLVPGKRQY